MIESTRERRPVLSPFRLLLIAVVAFVVVSFLLSWLRSVEFLTTTWDLGTYEQALWTTAHGRAFYETPDVVSGGYGSLLQIHSVFLLYLLVPLYGVLPFETTLFAVQSAAVGLAAVPLFFLAKDRTSSARMALATGLVYLAFTPVLSATLYDFHPEAFLPVEMFTLVLLWERDRYPAGFLVAGVAFATLEIAPVLAFFVGVLGLLETIPFSSSNRWPRTEGNAWRIRWSAFRNWIARRRVRNSLGLIAASLVAYELLLYLRVDVLTNVLGTYPLPTPATGYVIGGTPAGLQLSGSNLVAGLGTKLSYWLVVVALLGFVPLLAPRALVLSAPWFGFTLFSANENYATLGFQYGFIVAATLLVAFAYGLPNAHRAVQRFAVSIRRAGAVLRRTSAREPTARAAPARPRSAVWMIGFAALIAVNLAFSPMNPLLDNSTAFGSGYRLSYDPNPHDGQVNELVALLPAGATVVASDNLFPLVADDANAYSFSWAIDPGYALPFSPTHLPPYVLLSQDQRDEVPGWLPSILYDPSAYGVRGVVWSSDPGVVLLFQANYAGAATEFGAIPDSGGVYFGGSVAFPPAGLVTTATGSTYSSVVASAPGALGLVWFGPGESERPGMIRVTVSLRADVVEGASPPSPNATAVLITAQAWGTTLAARSLPLSALDGPGWTVISFTVAVSEPTIEFGIAGTVLDRSVQLTLNDFLLSEEADGSGGPGG